MAFQEDSLLPWRTVRRNVELALSLNGVPRQTRGPQVDLMLDEVGLAAFADYRPGQLSGGMRQRAQIARTMILRPRILLMDEPFGALDATTRASAQRLLLRVWRDQQCTIVFVTHDVDEALGLGDRLVVLSACPTEIRCLISVPHCLKVDYPALEDSNNPSAADTDDVRRELRAFVFAQLASSSDQESRQEEES